MNETLETIAETLRTARKTQGLTQRELGKAVGIPQSHISKIEHAVVDLQVSSLIQLARALELELMLVPRALIPTVKSLFRKQMTSFDPEEQIPLYRLDEQD